MGCTAAELHLLLHDDLILDVRRCLLMYWKLAACGCWKLMSHAAGVLITSSFVLLMLLC
jgi:hypothetical protein